MLSPIGEPPQNPRFFALARASLSAYPKFVEQISAAAERPIEFAAPGKLEVAFTREEARVLRLLLSAPRVRSLNFDELRALEPALNPLVMAAVHLADDAYVDNRVLGEALWQAAEKNGTRFRLGETVTAVRSSRGRVTGVTANGQSVPAGAVIVAAGAWSAQIKGLPRELPVLPVRGQMIALRCLPQPFRMILQSQHCYIIPRAGGRVLVGATVERVGFDPRTTATGLLGLVSAALEVVPALADAEVLDYWTGFRPGSPDDLPILGADPELSGLFYATGHYRNGILLTPVTSTLIADLVEGRDPEYPLDVFRPDRFAHE
jgi:glycine oxidase